MSPRFALSMGKRKFLESALTGLIPPLYVDMPYEPPVRLYPFFSGPMSFLLESVKGPPKIARYSLIGFDPYLTFKAKDRSSYIETEDGRAMLEENPLKTLDRLLKGYKQAPARGLPPFQGGLAGLLSYDFLKYLEKIPSTTRDDMEVPDAHFVMVDRLIAFDHLSGKAWAVSCPGARGDDRKVPAEIYDEAEHALSGIMGRLGKKVIDRDPGRPARLDISHDVSEGQYVGMVRRAKDYIAAGDIFQANLSLRVSAYIGGTDPWGLYTTLRDINPSPFAGFFDFGDYQIVSSSPERLIRVQGGVAETRPIAGTRPRGRNEDEDSAMRRELLLNDKERAEHIMLIDLERNDLGRVCDYGSVTVDELMITEDYSHVIHIVSNVKGRLAPSKTLVDAIRAAFPGGTITGVPKVRCMQIIDELEQLRRGPYTGSLGYIGFSGNMDLNIIIRTFTVKDGMAYVNAGAGVVADSDPAGEYRESLKKAEALIKTLEKKGVDGRELY